MITDPAVLLEALGILADPQVWWQVAIGVIIGITVGALPGMTTSAGMALALPAVLVLPVAPALGLIIGIYKGSTFGGSIAAIVFSAPGTPGAAMTAIDGYPLMRQGKGRKALQTALYSSVTGDVVSDIFTLFVAPVLAVVALAFGPGERAALVIMAFMLIGSLASDSPLKGLFSASVGITLGTVGLDPVAMRARLTFGQPWLVDGIDIVPLTIGVFAISEMLMQAAQLDRSQEAKKKVADVFKMGIEKLSLKEYLSCYKQIIMGIIIGIFCGILPGLGSTGASMIAYSTVSRTASKELKERLGKGAIEGIAAAESANNATVGPVLVPLLSFGIPGSVPAALIGGALMLKGLTPSPMLFETHAPVITAILLILILANFVNLGIANLLFPIYSRLGVLPQSMIIPVIFLLAVAGSYAYRLNPWDVATLMFCGLIGYLFKVFDYPIPPLVLAFMLTPLVETSVRRGLTMHGDIISVFHSPLSITLLVIAFIVFLFSFNITGMLRKKQKEEGVDE